MTDPVQKASFKYIFLWNPVSAEETGLTAGWSEKRPEISWGIANPVVGTGDFVPSLLCKHDGTDVTSDPPTEFDHLSPTQLAALLPDIPNVEPFATQRNSYPQYKYEAGKKAKACVAQQGKTPIGVDTDSKSPTFGKILVQYWTKVIDESDLSMRMP